MEYCSSKRIFAIVLALLGFSILVFFVEEYVEIQDEDGNSVLKRVRPEEKSNVKQDTDKEKNAVDVSTGTSNAKPLIETAKHNSEDCWKREPYTVILACQKCSEFEVRALKAKHCQATGFFDRVNCSVSGAMALRSCNTKQLNSSSFYAFFAFNVVLMVASYFFSKNRKSQLDRISYTRLNQHVDE